MDWGGRFTVTRPARQKYVPCWLFANGRQLCQWKVHSQFGGEWKCGRGGGTRSGRAVHRRSGGVGITVDRRSDEPRWQSAQFITTVLRTTITGPRPTLRLLLTDLRPRPRPTARVVQVRRWILAAAVVFEHRLLATSTKLFITTTHNVAFGTLENLVDLLS